MRSFKSFGKIYLYRPFVDMRKQSHGLSLTVQEILQMDPFSNTLFVFCNKNRDLIKCLYFDKTGFALWVKKLDQDKFPWPRKLDENVIYLSPKKMAWLLDGVDFTKLKPHKSLKFAKID